MRVVVTRQKEEDVGQLVTYQSADFLQAASSLQMHTVETTLFRLV